MTARASFQAPLLRWALATVALLDLLSFPAFLRAARAAAAPAGGFAEILSRPQVAIAVAGVGVAAAIAFARRPGRIGAGLLTLVALGLLSSAHARLFGSPWRHLYYSGLCLSGWIAGLALSRREGNEEDEGYARSGLIALLGAAYFNAGVSKIVYGGGDWLSGVPIQAVILGQDGLVSGGWLGAYRVGVVNTPALAAFFSIATVLLELAGPLMLVGWRTRLAVAAGLLAMHANIYLLTTHILYWEAMVFLALAAVSTREPLPARENADTPWALRGRTFSFFAWFLAFVALIAIFHQRQRYRDAQHREAASTPAIPAATALPRLQNFGPFTAGEKLTAGWTIEAIEPAADGVRLRVAGARGRAHFELTCADSLHDSPFDLGTLHIFYSNDLSYEALQDAGAAVRERLAVAAGDADPCTRFRAWRRSDSAETAP